MFVLLKPRFLKGQHSVLSMGAFLWLSNFRKISGCFSGSNLTLCVPGETFEGDWTVCDSVEPFILMSALLPRVREQSIYAHRFLIMHFPSAKNQSPTENYLWFEFGKIDGELSHLIQT